MNDPIRNAKPVGPPPPGSPAPVGPPPPGDPAPAGSPPPGSPAPAGSPPPPARGAAEPGVGAHGHGGQQAPPGQPRMHVYSWSSSGRRMPWLAILLVALGLGLLVELLIPELTFFSLILLAAGAAFAVAAIMGRVVGATVPALVLVAWALARMSGELGYLSGDGWSALFVGVALLVAWGLGRRQHVRREWALWLGVILGVIGLADASDTLPLDLDMAIVIPVAMIGVGIYLIMGNRLPTR